MSGLDCVPARFVSPELHTRSKFLPETKHSASARILFLRAITVSVDDVISRKRFHDWVPVVRGICELWVFG